MPPLTSARPAMARRAAAALTLMLATTDPTPSRADEFEDFRIPPHRVLLWTGSIGTGGSRSKSGSDLSQIENGNIGASGATQWSWYYDSDPSYMALGASGTVAGLAEGTSRLNQFWSTTSTSRIDEEFRRRSMNEQIGANAALRRYPWAIPIGGSLAAAGAGLYDQQWSSADFENQQRIPPSSLDRVVRTSDERWQHTTAFVGTASVVFGRVRDATAVYEVMVLEDRLREAGVIGRALSPAARERLAAITYERFALSIPRERPARTVWGAIEQVLRDDGALVDAGLDGYSIFRAVEPYFGPSLGVDATGLPKSPVLRQRGAMIGPAFRYVHSHTTVRLDQNRFEQETVDGVANPPVESSVHTSDELNRDEPVGGAQAFFHRPFGKEWQLDVTGELMIPMAEDRLQLTTFERASLVYLMADRWQAQVDLQHEWIDEVRTSGATSGDRWRWEYGATVRYYLEDRTAVELGLGEEQRWLRGDPGHSYQRFGSVNLGLVYRFAGWFDAPAFPAP